MNSVASTSAKKSRKKDALGRLSRLGFSSLPECLLTAPRSFRDFSSPVRTFNTAAFGQKHYFAVQVLAITLYDSENNATILWNDAHQVRIEVLDDHGKQARATVFGNVWPWRYVSRGDMIYLYAELNNWFGHLRLDSPELIAPEEQGRVAPVYAGKPGQVSAALLAKGIAAARPAIAHGAQIMLDRLRLDEDQFRRITGNIDAVQLLSLLHEPPSVAAGHAAIETARKLCALELVRRAERMQQRPAVHASAIAIDPDVVASLIGRLPFSLTADQHAAINQINADLRSPVPMARILSGDVGTGKTLAFAIPAVAAHLASAKVAVLVPTQLLVPQIAGEIRGLFPEIPVCEVVSGSTIAEGIVVGTTAVLAAATKQNLAFDFVITDEQHRFGISQKAQLVKEHTNLLEATATVIPRTLAMVGYGGMEISLLTQNPVHKVIATRIVEAAEADRLFAFVQKVLDRKGQVAVIYPFVEKTADASAPKAEQRRAQRNVMEGFERWSRAFPGRVGVVHGRMEDGRKLAAIDKLRAREFDILVASSVIEVGMTVPALKAVIVVHPERYGACQLHQLRGRVARHGGRGYFFLFIPEEVSPQARSRLQLLVDCDNGYELAERDLEARGFGNVDSSDAQTGATRLLFWGVDLAPKDIEMTAKSWRAENTAMRPAALTEKAA
jgi:ATP-dependent DNA helicase RecG